MNQTRRMIALLLAAIMVVTAFAGCAGKDTSWIVKDSGGTAVPVGVYLYYRMQAYTDALSKVEDKEKDAWKQSIDGTPVTQWVSDKAMESVKKYVATEEQFAAAGYTLVEEQDTYAKNQGKQNFEYYQKLYEVNGVSEDSIVKVYLNNMRTSVLFQNTYAPGGKTPVTETEMKKALTDGYVQFKTLIVSKKDAEGNLLDEAGQKQAKAKAEDYLAKARGGSDFEKLIVEAEDAFIKADKGISYLPTESDYNHDHTDPDVHITLLSKESTDVATELIEAVDKAANESFGMTEDVEAYYVYYKMDIVGDGTNLKTMAAQLTSDLKADEFDAVVLEWANTVQITENPDALSRYGNAKVKNAKAS